MSTRQLELIYRTDINFSSEQWQQWIRQMVTEMGFDETMRYELVIENQARERTSYELELSQLSNLVHSQNWPDIHQVLFSNQWMKDMNLKVQCVRRQELVQLVARVELADAARREEFKTKMDAWMNQILSTKQCLDSMLLERERLFGSMLLNPKVVQLAREPFLAGNFVNCLQAVTKLLDERIYQLLHLHLQDEDPLRQAMLQIPPRLLFPNLSGQALHQELKSLGHLLTGTYTLLEPVLIQEKQLANDPFPVLKLLVLLSLLVERLEGASPNPAIIKKPRPGKKAISARATRVPSRKAKRTSRVVRQRRTSTRQKKNK